MKCAPLLGVSEREESATRAFERDGGSTVACLHLHVDIIDSTPKCVKCEREREKERAKTTVIDLWSLVRLWELFAPLPCIASCFYFLWCLFDERLLHFAALLGSAILFSINFYYTICLVLLHSPPKVPKNETPHIV